MPLIHKKSLLSPYPGSEVKRFPLLKAEHVLWTVKLPVYRPVNYTDKSVSAEPFWADKDADRAQMKWNAVDGNVNRKSSLDYPYEVIDNMPRNPLGRTGICGRGLLGKFGPNHAADPVVTRWKRRADGSKVLSAIDHPILEIVMIRRKDNNELALPGGMVDAGDTVGRTLRKEFGEEAMASIEGGAAKAEAVQAAIERIFASEGTTIYTGYVDDPRNTDNAWMETTVVNFHDETGEGFGEIPLEAGDDAQGVAWVEAEPGMNLFASHSDFVNKTIEMRLKPYKK